MAFFVKQKEMKEKKNCELSMSLEIVFLKGCPLSNFFLDIGTQEFFWGQVSFTELQFLWRLSDP